VEVLKFLRKRHFQGTICVTSAFYNRAVLNANKELVEGVYLPLPSFDPQSKAENVQKFVKAYRERFGAEPDIFAAHAYDAMRVALFVLANTKYQEATEYRKTLQFGLNDFQGVTGVIRFDDYGDVHHNPIIYIIKNGEVLNFERYRKEQLARIRKEIMGLTGG
jgi:branched-chain amino acid transport system substrate-binding protein